MFSVVVSQGFLAYGLNKIATTLCYRQTAPLSPGEVKVLYCQNQPVGTHVVIVKSNAHLEPLSLCEVEVYGQLFEENIARGKKAFQSSDKRKPTAWKSLDGNISPNYYDGSCSTTLTEFSAEWWTVDLVHMYTIARLVITNRGDCCSENLRDYYVIVTDQLLYRDPAARRSASRLCSDRRKPELAGGDIVYITCLPRATGRFVTVYKENEAKDEPLIMCEVEIYGHRILSRKNMARGCLVDEDLYTPGEIRGGEASSMLRLLTDGVEETSPESCYSLPTYENNLFHWLRLDLRKGTIVKVVALLMYSTKKAQESTFHVLVSSTRRPRSLVNVNSQSNYTVLRTVIQELGNRERQYCTPYSGTPLRGQYVHVYCPDRTWGRFVMVVSELHQNQHQHICEIEVYSEHSL